MPSSLATFQDRLFKGVAQYIGNHTCVLARWLCRHERYRKEFSEFMAYMYRGVLGMSFIRIYFQAYLIIDIFFMIDNGPFVQFLSTTTHGIQKFPLSRRQGLIYADTCAITCVIQLVMIRKELMSGFLLMEGLMQIIGLLM